MMRTALVFFAGIATGLLLFTLLPGGDGAKQPARSRPEWGGEAGVAQGPRSTELLDPVRRATESVEEGTSSGHEDRPLPDADLAKSDWDDRATMRHLSEAYAGEFLRIRSESLRNVEAMSLGDANVEANARCWSRFDPSLGLDESVFEGLSQANKYALSDLLSCASGRVRKYGGRIPDDLTPEEELQLRRRLRNELLNYSPEFVLNDELGTAWRKKEALVGEVRRLWREMLTIAAPIHWERDLRHVSAMTAVGGYVDPEDVRRIAPDVVEYDVAMEALSQEFHGKLMSLIDRLGRDS